jgi:hypothetical protein
VSNTQKVTYTDLKGSIIVALLFWFTPIYIAFLYIRPEPSIANIIKTVLLFIGVFSAMMLQHLLHRFTKASSNPLPVDPRHMIVLATVAFACALILSVLSTALLWVWIILGVLAIFGYSLTRRFWYSNEILIGIAWSAIFFGTYTLYTSKLLPPLNVLLMFIGLAGYYGLFGFVYRVVTGDYGCPIPREVFNKLILQLFISIMILCLSIVV